MKFRMKNWYWGNYITLRNDERWYDNKGILFEGKINQGNLVEYIEERDGWQHSEEFKKYGVLK